MNTIHYPKRYREWIGRNMLQPLGIVNSHIDGCTEHKREGITFRGHPSYRGGCGWFDWALFQWDLYVPGHIITFLELSEIQLDKFVDSEYIIGDEPGIYALIESLEEELLAPRQYDRIVTIAGKALTAEQRKLRQNECLDIRRSNILLVTVECIYEPISVIPNFGGGRGEYVFIRSPHTWGDCFTDYIGGT